MKYLGLPEVSKALNINPPRAWEECNNAGSMLGGDLSQPPFLLLPELLKTITLSMFMGDKDIICNWIGLSDMVDNLSWNGKTGFNVLFISIHIITSYNLTGYIKTGLALAWRIIGIL